MSAITHSLYYGFFLFTQSEPHKNQVPIMKAEGPAGLVLVNRDYMCLIS